MPVLLARKIDFSEAYFYSHQAGRINLYHQIENRCARHHAGVILSRFWQESPFAPYEFDGPNELADGVAAWFEAEEGESNEAITT